MKNYIHELQKHNLETLLKEFADTTGFILDYFCSYNDHITISLIYSFERNCPIRFSLNYNLYNFCLTQAEGDMVFRTRGRMLEIQKAWRIFLKKQFGKEYVTDFNIWIEKQKLGVDI